MSDPTSPSTGSPAAARMADTLSDDALIQLFAYDAHAALALHEVSVRAAAGLRVHDLAYASPGGGSLTAFLVVPAGPGPFAGIILQHGVAQDEHGVSLGRELLLPYAIYLAPAGVVSLLIDAPFRGLRMRAGRPDHLPSRARIATSRCRARSRMAPTRILCPLVPYGKSRVTKGRLLVSSGYT